MRSDMTRMPARPIAVGDNRGASLADRATKIAFPRHPRSYAAHTTHLAVAPLTVTPFGTPHLDGPGGPIGWPVEMRRLPSQRMPDAQSPAGLFRIRRRGRSDLD